ncbi:MAG: hypothetical protein DCC57_09995 [Chloroflexi bacterium]|nr:MAG: hypothetical protein DCC57_09995 [Chloroflexota bacterium]
MARPGKTWPPIYPISCGAARHAPPPARKTAHVCFSAMYEDRESIPQGGKFVKQGPDTPQGTIALLLVYLLVILALWGNVYFTMVSRGVAQ